MKAEKVSCIILAGGRSSRLDSYKPLLRLGGKHLIEYAHDLARKIFSDIVVVVKDEEQKLRLGSILSDANIVKDGSSVFSPIAGIKAGVKRIKNNYFFLLACDMPFLNEKTLSKLISKLDEKSECIVYAGGKGYEPLCAIYRRGFFDDCNLDDSVNGLIEGSEKTSIPVKNEKAFFNVNTAKDLEVAKSLLKSRS